MTNIPNLDRLAKGAADSNTAINTLVKSFSLESVRDTLNDSFYAAFESGGFSDNQKSSILLTIQELNRVLPRIFSNTEDSILNNEKLVPDDVWSDIGRDGYIEGLRILFIEYLISDYTEGMKSEDRRSIRNQYAALESLIYAFHNEEKIRNAKRIQRSI